MKTKGNGHALASAPSCCAPRDLSGGKITMVSCDVCAQTESCHLIYLQETLWQKNSRVFARRQLIIKQSFLMRGARGEINEIKAFTLTLESQERKIP